MACGISRSSMNSVSNILKSNDALTETMARELDSLPFNAYLNDGESILLNKDNIGIYVTSLSNQKKYLSTNYNKRIESFNPSVLIGTKEEAVSLMKDTFKDLGDDEISFIENVSGKSINEIDAFYGKYSDGNIILSSVDGLVDFNVLRHEMVHKVFNEYITSEQQSELINEVNLMPEYSDWLKHNKELEFPQEEFIADYYNVYKESVQKTSLIGRFLNYIRSLFSGYNKINSRIRLNDFYSMINNGVINKLNNPVNIERYATIPSISDEDVTLLNDKINSSLSSISNTNNVSYNKADLFTLLSRSQQAYSSSIRSFIKSFDANNKKSKYYKDYFGSPYSLNSDKDTLKAHSIIEYFNLFEYPDSVKSNNDLLNESIENDFGLLKAMLHYKGIDSINYIYDNLLDRNDSNSMQLVDFLDKNQKEIDLLFEKTLEDGTVSKSRVDLIPLFLISENNGVSLNSQSNDYRFLSEFLPSNLNQKAIKSIYSGFASESKKASSIEDESESALQKEIESVSPEDNIKNDLSVNLYIHSLNLGTTVESIKEKFYQLTYKQRDEISKAIKVGGFFSKDTSIDNDLIQIIKSNIVTIKSYSRVLDDITVRGDFISGLKPVPKRKYALKIESKNDKKPDVIVDITETSDSMFIKKFYELRGYSPSMEAIGRYKRLRDIIRVERATNNMLSALMSAQENIELVSTGRNIIKNEARENQWVKKKSQAEAYKAIVKALESDSWKTGKTSSNFKAEIDDYFKTVTSEAQADVFWKFVNIDKLKSNIIAEYNNIVSGKTLTDYENFEGFSKGVSRKTKSSIAGNKKLQYITGAQTYRKALGSNKSYVLFKSIMFEDIPYENLPISIQRGIQIIEKPLSDFIYKDVEKDGKTRREIAFVNDLFVAERSSNMTEIDEDVRRALYEKNKSDAIESIVSAYRGKDDKNIKKMPTAINQAIKEFIDKRPDATSQDIYNFIIARLREQASDFFNSSLNELKTIVPPEPKFGNAFNGTLFDAFYKKKITERENQSESEKKLSDKEYQDKKERELKDAFVQFYIASHMTSTRNVDKVIGGAGNMKNIEDFLKRFSVLYTPGISLNTATSSINGDKPTKDREGNVRVLVLKKFKVPVNHYSQLGDIGEFSSAELAPMDGFTFDSPEFTSLMQNYASVTPGATTSKDLMLHKMEDGTFFQMKHNGGSVDVGEEESIEITRLKAFMKKHNIDRITTLDAVKVVDSKYVYSNHSIEDIMNGVVIDDSISNSILELPESSLVSMNSLEASSEKNNKAAYSTQEQQQAFNYDFQISLAIDNVTASDPDIKNMDDHLAKWRRYDSMYNILTDSTDIKQKLINSIINESKDSVQQLFFQEFGKNIATDSIAFAKTSDIIGLSSAYKLFQPKVPGGKFVIHPDIGYTYIGDGRLMKAITNEDGSISADFSSFSEDSKVKAESEYKEFLKLSKDDRNYVKFYYSLGEVFKSKVYSNSSETQKALVGKFSTLRPRGLAMFDDNGFSEILVPERYRDIIESLKEKLIASKKMTPEAAESEAVKHFNIFGSRIPNTSLSSNNAYRIKGYISGERVVVPYAVMGASGHDNDGDSLFAFMTALYPLDFLKLANNTSTSADFKKVITKLDKYDLSIFKDGKKGNIIGTLKKYDADKKTIVDLDGFISILEEVLDSKNKYDLTTKEKSYLYKTLSAAHSSKAVELKTKAMGGIVISNGKEDFSIEHLRKRLMPIEFSSINRGSRNGLDIEDVFEKNEDGSINYKKVNKDRFLKYYESQHSSRNNRLSSIVKSDGSVDYLMLFNELNNGVLSVKEYLALIGNPANMKSDPMSIDSQVVQVDKEKLKNKAVGSLALAKNGFTLSVMYSGNSGSKLKKFKKFNPALINIDKRDNEKIISVYNQVEAASNMYSLMINAFIDSLKEGTIEIFNMTSYSLNPLIGMIANRMGFGDIVLTTRSKANKAISFVEELKEAKIGEVVNNERAKVIESMDNEEFSYYQDQIAEEQANLLAENEGQFYKPKEIKIEDLDDLTNSEETDDNKETDDDKLQEKLMLLSTDVKLNSTFFESVKIYEKVFNGKHDISTKSNGFKDKLLFSMLNTLYKIIVLNQTNEDFGVFDVGMNFYTSTSVRHKDKVGENFIELKSSDYLLAMDESIEIYDVINMLEDDISEININADNEGYLNGSDLQYFNGVKSRKVSVTDEKGNKKTKNIISIDTYTNLDNLLNYIAIKVFEYRKGKNDPINMKEAYNKSKAFFWNYIAYKNINSGIAASKIVSSGKIDYMKRDSSLSNALVGAKERFYELGIKNYIEYDNKNPIHSKSINTNLDPNLAETAFQKTNMTVDYFAQTGIFNMEDVSKTLLRIAKTFKDKDGNQLVKPIAKGEKGETLEVDPFEAKVNLIKNGNPYSIIPYTDVLTMFSSLLGSSENKEKLYKLEYRNNIYTILKEGSIGKAGYNKLANEYSKVLGLYYNYKVLEKTLAFKEKNLLSKSENEDLSTILNNKENDYVTILKDVYNFSMKNIAIHYTKVKEAIKKSENVDEIKDISNVIDMITLKMPLEGNSGWLSFNPDNQYMLPSIKKFMNGELDNFNESVKQLRTYIGLYSLVEKDHITPTFLAPVAAEQDFMKDIHNLTC